MSRRRCCVLGALQVAAGCRAVKTGRSGSLLDQRGTLQGACAGVEDDARRDSSGANQRSRTPLTLCFSTAAAANDLPATRQGLLDDDCGCFFEEEKLTLIDLIADQLASRAFSTW